MSTRTVGPLVKQWRARRRLSQIDLAHRVGVSTRHLSFVETGRSQPSRELVTALGIELEVPLRDQNTMLLAAGYAPRYTETTLDAVEATAARSAVATMLTAHDPFPGLAVDRGWDVVARNEAAATLLSVVPDELAAPPVNVYRLSLHPDGLVRYTRNLVEWGSAMLRQLERDLATTADPRLAALLAEIRGYPAMTEIQSAPLPPTSRLLVPFEITIGGIDLAFFTTITTFGTPRDITFEELAIELFYPMDEATRSALGG